VSEWQALIAAAVEAAKKVVVFFFSSFVFFATQQASKRRGDRGFYGREGVGLSGKEWTRSGLPAHALHTLRHGVGKP
jgi:hypothetical protein